MRLSLLYPEPSVRGRIENSIRDFSVERLVTYVLGDITNRDYILSVLSEFETNITNIRWRQGIIQDLLKNRGLIRELTEKLSEAKNLYEEFKKSQRKLKQIQSHYLSLDYFDFNSLYILKETAEEVNHLITLYDDLETILTEYKIESCGLSYLKEFIVKRTHHRAMPRLREILAQLIKNRPYSTNYRLLVHLNGQLNVSFCGLSGFTENSTVEKVTNFWGKRIRAPHITVKYDNETIEQTNFFVLSAGFDMADTLKAVFIAFSEPIQTLLEEIKFFDFAVKYAELMNQIDVKFCLPAIHEAKVSIFKCTELRDPLLGFTAKIEFKITMEVIANDIALQGKTGGILIKGKNNTGKTVFMRSIGLSQLFAQAGLPVAAETADISIKNGIYSLFASKENKEESGGRFEQEVLGIERLVELADRDSLIFFNEVFQSTSASEGENALIDILGYFAASGSLVIAVTHLNGLFMRQRELLETAGKDFVFLETYEEHDDNRYKLHVTTKA